jgi:hypothetical protein
MWQVLDNHKPANGTSYNLYNEDYGKSEFSSFDDAHEYALHWLGQWGRGLKLQPNTPYDYSGYGDIIEIKSI